MTDAEFLDDYVEQMIAILEDALKHDGVAPALTDDAREIEIRRAIGVNTEHLDQWRQIKMECDPEDFKASVVMSMSKFPAIRTSFETHLKMCRSWYSMHYPCSYCGDGPDGV